MLNFQNCSASVFTEEEVEEEEEDGELFKTEISFTGMPGKLLVSGKKWKRSSAWHL